MHSPISEKARMIKFAKKEAFLAKELIPVIEQTLRESPCLERVYVTRVTLSKEGGCISIFVWSMDGAELSREALDALKNYKPAIRKLTADILCSKWTPQIAIRVDQKVEKVRHTNELMNEVFAKEHSLVSPSLEEMIRVIKDSCEK